MNTTITVKNLWMPVLMTLRDLAADTETIVKRRALLSEMAVSQGVDVAGSADEMAQAIFNKTIYYLRSEGLITHSGSREFRVTDRGFNAGQPTPEFLSTLEDPSRKEVPSEEREYVKPLWANDALITNLVAGSTPCFGFYSPRNRGCTHECAISGACHARTVGMLSREVDKCPKEAVLQPVEDGVILPQFKIGPRGATCGISGDKIKPGEMAYSTDEYGLVSVESAKKLSKEKGWSLSGSQV